MLPGPTINHLSYRGFQRLPHRIKKSSDLVKRFFGQIGPKLGMIDFDLGFLIFWQSFIYIISWIDSCSLVVGERGLVG